MWRGVERRAVRFGIPFDGIPPYPIGPDELANHVATLAALEGWCPQFVQAAYRTWFLDKRDPGQLAALRAILERMGRPADRSPGRASAKSR